MQFFCEITKKPEIILYWKKPMMNKSKPTSFLSFTLWRTSKARVWTKSIALVISLAFLLPCLSWAFDGSTYLAPPPLTMVQHLGKALRLPEKFGRIKQDFQGNGKLIVHIQDLHCNYEVQMNIARTIHHLAAKYGLRLVGEEGAFHTVNTAKISAFPLKKVREEVGDYFVKQGKLTGAEYYAGTGEYPIQLEGIETPALYHASMEAVHSFLNYESQGYCYDLRETLDEMKTSVYTPLLKEFDDRHMAYREGDLEMLKYCGHLQAAARRLKQDLSVYPNLVRFLSLKQDYFSQEIDSDQLFQELDLLDTAIRNNFYTNQAERELDELYRRLDVIEKLLNISAAPKDLNEFRVRRSDFNVRVFVEFIKRQDTTGEYLLEPEVYRLDEYLEGVEKFYRLADERSRHFVDNLYQKMEQRGEKLALMITGGFHTAEVLQEMQNRDISYVSITPCLTRQDVVNPYFSLLRNKQMPLEKLLSKNQEIMAVQTACPDLPGIATNQVVPLARVKSLPQRTFARMLGLLFKNTTVVTLHSRGIETEDIPGNLEKILRIYPANDPFLRLDSVAFLKENTGILNRLGKLPFLVIPMRVGNEDLTTIAYPEDSIAPRPKLMDPAMQTIDINGSKYFYYNTQNISDLVELLVKNQKGPSLLFLPEMSWWNMLGFWGRIARLAWALARNEKLSQRYASAKVFALRIPAWAARIPALFKERLKARDYSAAGLIGKYQPLEEPEYNPDEGVISFKARNIDTNKVEQVSIKAEAYTDTEAIIQRIFSMYDTDNETAKSIIEWYGEQGWNKNFYLLDSDNAYQIHGLAAKKMIAVSKKIKNEPLAWFHEIAEAMAAAGELNYKNILENLSDENKIWYEEHLAKEGRAGLELHYAIRALQREAFRERDQALGDKIKDRGYRAVGDNIEGPIGFKEAIAVISAAGVPFNNIIFPFMNQKDKHAGKELEFLYSLIAGALQLSAERQEGQAALIEILEDADSKYLNYTNEMEDRIAEAKACLNKIYKWDKDTLIKVLNKAIDDYVKALSPMKYHSKTYQPSGYVLTRFIITEAVKGGDQEILTGVLENLVHEILEVKRQTVDASKSLKFLQVLFVDVSGIDEGGLDKEIFRGFPEIKGKALDVIGIQLRKSLIDNFREEVYVDIEQVKAIPGAEKYFRMDEGANRAYFEDDFIHEIRYLRDEGKYKLLSELYNENHFKREAVQEIYQQIMRKDKNGVLKQNLLDSLEKEAHTENVRRSMFKILAENWQKEDSSRNLDRLCRLIIATCGHPGVSDSLREDLITNLAKISELISTPEVQQEVFELVKDGFNKPVSRANILCDNTKKTDEELKVLDKEMENINNRLRVLSSLAEKTGNENILEYMMEIAGNETWHSHIISEITTHLEKHIKSDNPGIIKFYIERLEPQENHDAINEIISNNQDKFFSGELEINERSQYLIILCHQKNPEFLKKTILSEMDIKFRLHALSYYLANFGEDVSEAEFNEICRKLDQDTEGDPVAAFIKKASRDNEKIEALYHNPWLQDEEFKVHLVAAMLDLRKNHPDILTWKGIKPIAGKLANAEMHPFALVCNSDYYFGERLLEKTIEKAAVFYQLMVHEFGHNILWEEIKYKIVDKKSGVLGEHWSDHLAADFAERFGLDFEELKKVLEYEREYKAVSGDDFNTVESHEGARAQLMMIEDELYKHGITLDHGKYIKVAFEVLRDENNGIKNLENIMQQILCNYLNVYTNAGQTTANILEDNDLGSILMAISVATDLKVSLLNPEKITKIILKFIQNNPDAYAEMLKKGVIPIVKNLAVEKMGIREDIYDNYIAPLWEEVVFTGVPIVIGMLSSPLFVPAFLIFRLAFILLHLFGARAPDGKALVLSNWRKSWTGILNTAKAIISQLAMPTLISTAVIILVSPNLTGLALAIAIVIHVLVNKWLQPLLNQELEKRNIKFRFRKALLSHNGEVSPVRIFMELSGLKESNEELENTLAALLERYLTEIVKLQDFEKNTLISASQITEILYQQRLESPGINQIQAILVSIAAGSVNLGTKDFKQFQKILKKYPLKKHEDIPVAAPDSGSTIIDAEKLPKAGDKILAPVIKAKSRPVQGKKIDDIIEDIWAENQKKNFPEGINLSDYPKEYGIFAIYHLIRDIREKMGYAEKISPQSLCHKINNIMGQPNYYRGQIVAEDHFQVLLKFLNDKLQAQELVNYGNPNGAGVASLVEEVETPGSIYAGMQGIHLGYLTNWLNSPEKVAALLRIEPGHAQLTNWNMPYMNLTWKQFKAIKAILKEKLEAQTLAGYGDEGGKGLAALLSEIERKHTDKYYNELQNINIGHLTDLLNSRMKIAGILGISPEHDQLTNWNMPYINMTGKQFRAIKEILQEKLDDEKLFEYGDESGKGLVALLSEIKSGDKAYADLRGINIGHLTNLLNSPKKVAGILGIDEGHYQLANWNMPKIDMTGKQFEAIQVILKEKLDDGTLFEYGNKSGKGLVALVDEIARGENAYADLRGIHIGHLTDLLNSRMKIAGILGISPEHAQLADWKMPWVNMTWKQFIRKNKIKQDMPAVSKPAASANLLAQDGVSPFFGAIVLANMASLAAAGPGFTTAALILAGFLGIRTLITGILEWLIHGQLLRGGPKEPGLVHVVDGKMRFNLPISAEFPLWQKSLIYILVGPVLISGSIHETVHKKFSPEIMAYGLESAMILAVLTMLSPVFWLPAMVGLFITATVMMRRDAGKEMPESETKIKPRDGGRVLYGQNEKINQRSEYLDNHPLIRKWAVMPFLGLILSGTRVMAALGLSVQPNISYDQVEDINAYAKIKNIKISHGHESRFIDTANLKPGQLEKIADRIILKPLDTRSLRGWLQNIRGMLWGYSRIWINEEGKMEIHLARRILASLDLSEEQEDQVPKNGLEARMAKLAEDQLKRIIEHQTAAYVKRIKHGIVREKDGFDLFDEIVLNTMEGNPEKETILNQGPSMRQALEQEKITVGPQAVPLIFMNFMNRLPYRGRRPKNIFNSKNLQEQLSLDMAENQDELRKQAQAGEENPLDSHPFWAIMPGIEKLLKVSNVLESPLSTFLQEFRQVDNQDIQRLAEVGAMEIGTREGSDLNWRQQSGDEAGVSELTTLACPETAKLMLEELNKINAAALDQGMQETLEAMKTTLKAMTESKTGDIVFIHGEICRILVKELAGQYAAVEPSEALPEAPNAAVMEIGRKGADKQQKAYAVVTPGAQQKKVKINGEIWEFTMPEVAEVASEENAMEVARQITAGQMSGLVFGGRTRPMLPPERNPEEKLGFLVLPILKLADKLTLRSKYGSHVRAQHSDPIGYLNYIQNLLPEVVQDSDLYKELFKPGSEFRELYRIMAATSPKDRRVFYRAQSDVINYMRLYMRTYYEIYGRLSEAGRAQYFSEDHREANMLNLRFFNELVIGMGSIIEVNDFAEMELKAPADSHAPIKLSLAAVLMGQGHRGALGGFTIFLEEHGYAISRGVENLFNRKRIRMAHASSV